MNGRELLVGAVTLATVMASGVAVSNSTAATPVRTRVVVAPRGSDSAAGTVAHPMRTVRAALHRLGQSGGTV